MDVVVDQLLVGEITKKQKCDTNTILSSCSRAQYISVHGAYDVTASPPLCSTL
ncbi:hypothetical protein Bpfe_004758, partial [Biomphalaria pfeifferi]